MTRFENVYYVSQHAVDQFKNRLRFENITDSNVRNLILSELQKRDLFDWQEYNHELQPIYKGEFRGITFLIPVIKERNKTDGELWDAVTTILLPGMKIYTPKKTITLYRASKMLGVDNTTVRRLIKQGIVKARPHEKYHVWEIYELSLKKINIKKHENSSNKYTAEDLNTIKTNLDISDIRIAEMLGRSPNAICIQRHRMGVTRNDHGIGFNLQCSQC